MTKVRPDKIIMSSMLPGFQYSGILKTTINISGTIPNGGKYFYGYITIPTNSFCSGFYSVSGSTIVANTDKMEIGNGYSAVDNAYGMTTYVKGSANNTTYTVSVLINNYYGSPVTVPTQTVTAYIYVFKSPFNS